MQKDQQQPNAGSELTADAGDRSARLGGLGRVIVAVYLVLALAATFRSIYQILSKFDEAPLAYILSAAAAVVYILATIALVIRRGVWRKIAWAALSFELLGVLIVGTLSLTHPQWFGHPSVWSHFGMGYLWIPLVLPVLGLAWLTLEHRGRSARSEGAFDGAAERETATSEGTY